MPDAQVGCSRFASLARDSGWYGLDRGALAGTAARIAAPTIDTIDRPLDAVPQRGGDIAGGSLAFRTFGVWS